MFAKIASKFFAHNLNRLYLFQCLAFLLLLIVVFSCASPFFFSLTNFSNILTASSVIGLMALGATFVIASGAIDLSTAAVMALSGVVCAWTVQNGHVSPIVAIFVAVITGALCGLVSGWLVNLTKAPSFIITLGMLSIDRALAYIITGGIPIYGLDDRVTSVGQGNCFGFPFPATILLTGALISYLLLSKTRFGAHTLVLGDSFAAAEAMGIPVKILRLKAFMLAGFFSGLAGFIFMTRTNSGDPSAGQNYELIAITAVILGGANLFGGRAAILGTLIGVLCLGVLQNGLNLLAMSTFYQILFVGIVLIAASFLRRLGERA